MIDGLEPYPAMKDSGVPWLGDVPAEWQVERGKSLFRKMERPVRDTDEVVTCFRDGTVTLRKHRRLRGFTESLKEIGYQGIRRGDLVIHAMDAFAGAIGVADADGKGTPVYSVCEPRPLADSRYYAYALREMARSQWIQALARGIRERSSDFRFEQFGSEYLPLPPHHEQAAIVRFLEHMDQRMRRYIRAKQKLIKLLEEQKQAIIHRAVTRGLDPNVRLKPSGVEWLGDAPAHWEVRLLGRCLSRIDQGWSPVAAEGRCEPEQWAVLTLSSVRRGAFNRDALKPVPMTALVPGGIELCDGDLLLTRSNTRELVGDACIARNPRHRTVICDLIYRLVPEPTIMHTHFLMFLLLSRVGRDQIERDARGSSGTMPKIAQRHIRSWQVLVPPIWEQCSIASGIEEAVGLVVRASERATMELEVLREYRTRLIADVVTGKLDVRAAAARLPDETEEEEEPEARDEMEPESDADDADIDDDTAETPATPKP